MEDATVYVGMDGLLASRGDPGASELKSWVSLARTLASFSDTDGDGLPDVPARYAAPEGRICEEPSLSPGSLLGGARWTTLLSLVLGLVLVIRAVVRARARRRR